MIEGLISGDSMPALERMMQFAGGRHRMLASNIANVDTPGYRAQDVDVDAFQKLLGDAIDHSRATNGNAGGVLELGRSREVELQGDRMILKPSPVGDNILFHDQNDRDVERTMQDLVENFMVYRTTVQMLRSRFDVLHTAIRGRL